jgi:carnitine-CoA ligase
VRDEHLTITDVLDRRAEEAPARTFLHILDVPVSYQELRERSLSAAHAFAGLGVRPGDRVAIFMNTCEEWLTAWFGAARLGAVAVPVNTAYRGDFLAAQLVDSRTSVVVTEDELAGRLFAVAAEVPTLRTAVVRGDHAAVATDAGTVEVQSTELLLAGDRSKPPPEADTAWNRPTVIFFTSGTTGRAKGAVATHNYLLSAAATMVDCWRLQPGEVVYGPLPLFHLSAIGTVLGPMLSGGTGVLEKAFSVNRTWDQVRRYEAAGIALAGAMVVMLWNLPAEERDADLPIRFLSAAPVPKEIYRGIEERYRCKVVTVYGLSEAFPLAYAGVDDDNPPGASGRANPAFEVRVVDDEDAEVPVGEVGEVVCRPRHRHLMFEGYDGREAATVEQLRNLWFHTGDLGRFDADGNFWFADRRKDAMRRRGENISSFEVEQALTRYPGVAEVAAIGVPSELGEDDVMVVVVGTDGSEFAVEPFMDFCCERLPYFAVPRYVDVVAELPKNVIGRVLKPVLRERGVSDTTWDRERAGYVVRR